MLNYLKSYEKKTDILKIGFILRALIDNVLLPSGDCYFEVLELVLGPFIFCKIMIQNLGHNSVLKVVP